MYVAITSCCERVGIDVQEVRRKRVRCWEYPPGTAYGSEFAQALPGSGA